MPIYEYACAACGHRFEELRKMSDPPVRICPRCKARKVERVISATSFHLKGGGWYADLYASPKPDGERKSGKESGSEGAKKSETTKKGGKAEAAAQA
jgi:putative FmdB family regulatory protein